MSDIDVGTKDTEDNIKVSNLFYKAKKEINNNNKKEYQITLNIPKKCVRD